MIRPLFTYEKEEVFGTLEMWFCVIMQLEFTQNSHTKLTRKRKANTRTRMAQMQCLILKRDSNISRF